MNMHTDVTTTPQPVALDDLYLHPMNPRQNGSDADTAAMARSIAVNGLLQNLLGYADPEHQGKIGIVAGGRRLHALQQLQSEGSGLMDSKEPDWDAIPVLVTDDRYQAQSWAGTESTTQRPLHPADEIRAYAAMADQGNSPETIAMAFAQTEHHVKGRLALAGLIPEALDALRAGHISLDVAKALTLAKSADQQLSVLTSARAGNWNAHTVRRELTNKTVRSDDRKARFITTALYEAEGGTMDSDLFEDHAYLHDSDLVDKLFTRELAAQAEALRETEGWSWVKTTENAWDDWNLTKDMQRIHRTPGDLPEGDLGDYEQLCNMAEQGDLTDQGHATLADLQSRIDGDFTDEDRDSGGIVVLVSNAGELKIEGAYCEKGKPAKPDSGTAPNTTSPKPALTQAGVEDLHRISLMALQGAMIDKSEFLLDLFAWQIDRGAPSFASPFAITLTDQNITPEAKGSWHQDPRLANPEHKDRDYNEDTAATFAAFQALGRKHRNQVIARALTRTLQRPDGSMAALGRVMVDFAGASIRKVWTPDGPTYFSRLSAPAMEAIWAELLELDEDDGLDRRTTFAKLKKAEKVGELSAMFSDASAQEALGLSRDQVATIDAWLPPELRAVEG